MSEDRTRRAAPVVSDFSTVPGAAFVRLRAGDVRFLESRPDRLGRAVGVQPSPPPQFWYGLGPADTIWVDVAETPAAGASISAGNVPALSRWCLRGPAAVPDSLVCPPASLVVSQTAT